jgi:hypothetical protein
MLAIYNYTFTRSSTDDVWDSYYRAMLSAKDIINLAGTQSPHYAGIAKVITAFSLGTLTSHYGDIPYTEALRASEGIVQPKFDSQESIYAAIQSLLDQAIADFGADNIGLEPSNDDVIYQGDISAWVAAAHALKARYYLHTAKVRPSNYALAISSANNAKTAGFRTFKITFAGSSSTSNAPWYQWREQRDDIIPNPIFLEFLDAKADPRKGIYFAADEESFGEYLQGPTGPVVLMYPSELDFIIAEAAVQGGDNGLASTALNAAVAASYTETGATGTYTAPVTVTLQDVIEQKYMASFLIPEAFVDWRRTGFPAITPIAGSGVPRKYPYPQKEQNYNGANLPAEASIPYLTRMWIDP